MSADHMVKRTVPLRVVVLDDYQHAAARFGDWARLEPGCAISFMHEHAMTEEELRAQLDGADVAVLMRERTSLPGSVICQLTRLKLVVTTGMVTSAIDIEAARAAGIVVCGTRGIPTPTAELTWALILGLVRHTADEDANLRAAGWQRTVGTDLMGATLGIVGLGNLGQQVARIGQAFGMNVIAWSQNLQRSTASALGCRAVTRTELFQLSDVVTVHLRLGDRSRGLITAADLALMKQTAVFVNTSRAAIVDYVALAALLSEGRLAGAGLDVFDSEPLMIDDPIRQAPHTLLTPHLGYVTNRSYDVFYRDVVEDIVAFRGGAPIRELT